MSEATHLPIVRPKTRGDCANVPRPCPYAGCKHHLLLKVGERDAVGLPKSRQEELIRLRFGHEEPDRLEHSCALDFADEGEHTNEEVAEALNVSRQAVDQMVRKALAKIEVNTKLLEYLEAAE